MNYLKICIFFYYFNFQNVGKLLWQRLAAMPLHSDVSNLCTDDNRTKKFCGNDRLVGVSEISVQVVFTDILTFLSNNECQGEHNTINVIYYIFQMDDFYDFGV